MCFWVKLQNVICNFLLLRYRRLGSFTPSTSTARISFVFHHGVRPCRPSSFIVEGRADVRIGIRDSVVHIDRTTARMATIVRIGTTEDSTEVRRRLMDDSSPVTKPMQN